VRKNWFVRNRSSGCHQHRISTQRQQNRRDHLPTCTASISMVGRLSMAWELAGGGPAFSSCPSNCKAEAILSKQSGTDTMFLLITPTAPFSSKPKTQRSFFAGPYTASSLFSCSFDRRKTGAPRERETFFMAGKPRTEVRQRSRASKLNNGAVAFFSYYAVLHLKNDDLRDAKNAVNHLTRILRTRTHHTTVCSKKLYNEAYIAHRSYYQVVAPQAQKLQEKTLFAEEQSLEMCSSRPMDSVRVPQKMHIKSFKTFTQCLTELQQ